MKTLEMKNYFNPQTMNAMELTYYLWRKAGGPDELSLDKFEVNEINLRLSRVGRKLRCKKGFTETFEPEGQPVLSVHRRADKTGVIRRESTELEEAQSRYQRTCERVARKYVPQLEAAIISGDTQRVQFIQGQITAELSA